MERKNTDRQTDIQTNVQVERRIMHGMALMVEYHAVMMSQEIGENGSRCRSVHYISLCAL